MNQQPNALAPRLQSWLRENARGKARMSARAKTYQYRTIEGGQRAHPILGVAVAEAQSIGVCVHREDEYFVVKEGPAKFCGVQFKAFAPAPELREGSHVVVKPYYMRDLDGLGFNEMSRKDRAIHGEHVMFIGRRSVKIDLPVQTDEMRNTLDMLCSVQMPNDPRPLICALVDAGARTETTVITEDVAQSRYGIRFAVSTARFTGTLEVRYDVGQDLYAVDLVSETGQRLRNFGLCFEDMGGAIEDAIAPPPPLGTIEVIKL